MEEAFAEWSGIDPKESAAWWHHPLRWLCRELEERLGIEREDLEIAAYRLTSELGLRGMGPLIAPDGTPDDDDKGQPDWLWMLPKFKELDRDGTTARLWQGLLEKFSAVLVEAKLVPVAGATLSTAKAEQGEDNGGKKPQTAEPPSSHIIGDLRDTIRNREWSDGYMVIMHIPDSLVLQRLFAYGRQKWGEGVDDSEVLNRLIDEVAHFCEKPPNEVSRLSLREFSSIFSKSRAQQTEAKRSVTSPAADTDGGEGNDGAGSGRPAPKGEIMASFLPFASDSDSGWVPLAQQIHEAVWDRVGLPTVQGFARQWADSYRLAKDVAGRRDDARRVFIEPWAESLGLSFHECFDLLPVFFAHLPDELAPKNDPPLPELPLPPDHRSRSPAEEWASLAAIHDVYWMGEKIEPLAVASQGRPTLDIAPQRARL